jgi:protein TonB
MITIAALAVFTLLCLLLGMDHAWSKETSAARNELVFEGRNHRYGAYSLRNGYERSVVRAFLAAIGLLAFAVAALQYFPRSVPPGVSIQLPQHAVDVDLHRIITPPPLTPNTAKQATLPPVQRKDPIELHYVQGVDSLVEPPVLPVDTAVGLVADGGAGAGGGTGFADDNGGTGLGTDLGTGATLENFQVEELPEFPGGQAAMGEWIRNNLDFPVDAEGKDMVYVQFVVGLDGSVEDVRAVKGAQTGNKRAAERAVRRMPKWKPARMNGHDVRCRLTLPIKFETR